MSGDDLPRLVELTEAELLDALGIVLNRPQASHPQQLRTTTEQRTQEAR
jgi:hypothetical protein